MDYPGNLFVVAAPSGAGKSSLVKALLELDSHLVGVGLAHHARAARPGAAGPRVPLHRRAASSAPRSTHGDFFEWAEVHGNLYGTSRAAIESRIAGGQDVVLEIDWQGALQIKKLFPHAVLIFILPPSWDELRQRLQRRGEDRAEVIEHAHGQCAHRGGAGPALRLRYNQRPVRDGALRPEDRSSTRSASSTLPSAATSPRCSPRSNLI